MAGSIQFVKKNTTVSQGNVKAVHYCLTLGKGHHKISHLYFCIPAESITQNDSDFLWNFQPRGVGVAYGGCIWTPCLVWMGVILIFLVIILCPTAVSHAYSVHESQLKLVTAWLLPLALQESKSAMHNSSYTVLTQMYKNMIQAHHKWKGVTVNY